MSEQIKVTPDYIKAELMQLIPGLNTTDEQNARCLNCGYIQPCGFDEVFVCESCGWPIGEAVP